MKLLSTNSITKGFLKAITRGVSISCLLLVFNSWGQTPIYADNIASQSHVNNANNSIDLNPFSFCEVKANSGALLGIGAYSGHIELTFPSLVPANQTCYVRIETDDNILQSLMGGSIGNLLSGVTGTLLTGNQEFNVQAKNGATVILSGNSTNPNDFSGEYLKVVTNQYAETFLAITPQQAYQSIRITNFVGSIVGLNTTKNMRVYDPYYVPSALECGRPTYTSYDAIGITLDLLQLNAGATNIHNAIDTDINSNSQLSLGIVTTPSWIEQKIYFEGLSNSGDIFGIRFRTNPSLNIVDLGSNIVIRAQDGAVTQNTATLYSLLTSQDIDSLLSSNPTTLYFLPGAPVDRICIRYSSLLGISLDQFLEIYEVFKIAPAPLYDVIASNDTVCKGTSGTLIAHASDPNLEIRWYMDSIGGLPIAVTPSGGSFVTPAILNDTTFWIAAGKPGCPDETFRIPISVWVIPSPQITDITFNINPAGYCVTDSVTIIPTSLLGNQFQWYVDSLSTQQITNGMQLGSLSFGIGSSGELVINGTQTINSPYTFWAAVQDSSSLCWNSLGEMSPAIITIIDEPTPTTNNANQIFCVLDSATLADVQINELNINWYDQNGISLPSTTLLTNGNYFVTAVGSLCESSDSLTISINIIDESAPTTTDNVQFFCITDMATLNDLNINQSNINWYDAASNGNLLPTSTSLVNGTTYYASSVGILCESSQLLAVLVTIDDLPTPSTQDTIQFFCSESNPTINDISTNESNINWYLQSTGGTPLPNNTLLSNNTTYYGALFSPTCESMGRLEVHVILEIVPSPTTSDTVQFFCNPGTLGSTLTIDDIFVNESNIVWYNTPNGGSPLTPGTPITDGETYYAASQGQYCESSNRLSVYVSITTVPTPTTTDLYQNFCTTIHPTIADLQVNETNINWYSSSGELLDEYAPLIDGESYFATQIILNCESSSQLMVTVNIVDQLDAQINGVTNNICLSDTLIYSAPSGMTNYVWSVIGGTIVNGGTTNSNTITIVWTHAPIHSIQVTYETTNGCVLSMEEAILVNIISCSDLIISKTVDNENPFVGDQVVFTIAVTNNGLDTFISILVDENIPSGYTYISYTSTNGSYNPVTGQWTILGLAGGQTAVLNITVKINPTGEYVNTATIMVSDPIDMNTENNSSSATSQPYCLTVYNEISPNGDGINDVLIIDCIDIYKNNSLTIFNRFGNEVYYTQSYMNDWDGVANTNGVIGKGEALPSGTYYYILRVEEPSFEGSGWIYIIR